MTKTVFVADDGFNGRELWATDGSAEGTCLLADLWPGGGPSNPYGLTQLDPCHVVFAATDPVHGTEPWITDGTVAGTHLLLDLNPAESGFGSSNPSGFARLGDGLVLFIANDPAQGSLAWTTDGTAAGTRPLNLLPGAGMSYGLGPFLPLGDGRALFAAPDAYLGTELWVTDGSDAGTHLVKDINPGSNGGYPSGFGTSDRIAFGDGRALLSADDGSHGRELWISDGTADGTYLLADLAPGETTYSYGYTAVNSSNPANFALLAPGRVLFSASDPEHGTELWTSDGTPAGTHLVLDLWPGMGAPYPGGELMPNSSGPSRILPLGDGRALFSADDSVHGREFWITDGTAAGTALVADLWPGGGSGNPGAASSLPTYPPGPGRPPIYGPGFEPGGALVLEDGRAIFSATDPLHGTEPWITDGTPEGTSRLTDINRGQQGFAGSNPSQFAALGNAHVAFTADDGVNGPEPWVTDGTAAGTRPLGDVYPGAFGSGANGYVTLLPPPPLIPVLDPSLVSDWLPG